MKNDMAKPYFESLKRNLNGGINGVYFSSQFPNGVPYGLDPAMGHITRAEAGEWGDIEEPPQSEKDAHAVQQASEAIKQELAALDVPSYKIERAIAGDQKAIDDIKEADVQKELLRAQL